LGIGYYLLKRFDLSQYKAYALKENAVMGLQDRIRNIDFDIEPECDTVFDYDHLSNLFNASKTFVQNCKSLSFPDAGFYIIKNVEDYMIINCSGKGKYPELNCGGHTHADLLSFELFIDGKSFLVDSGSYTYTSDPNQRMRFRSTFMHNTMVIDNLNQCTIKKESLWDIGNESVPTVLLWEETDDVISFMGKHNGYNRLPNPVEHKRQIDYNKKDRTWIITDMSTGTGSHSYDVYFHFDESIPVRILGNGAYTESESTSNIELEFSSDAAIEIVLMDDYISKSYGSKIPARVLIIKATAICPYKLVTIIKRK